MYCPSLAIILPVLSCAALAQDTASNTDDEVIEEIVTVGTQIRGARISGALSVSVINAETIEHLGIDSGDELLDLIPENGQNFFSESDTAGLRAVRAGNIARQSVPNKRRRADEPNAG